MSLKGNLRPALAGLIAGVAAVGAGHLVAGLILPAASPVLAVGGRLIDLTPRPVKEWGVATFGNADKPLLLLGVSLVAAALCAFAGILAMRKPRAAAAVVWGLALICLVAAVTSPALTSTTELVLAAIPAIVTGVVGTAALAWLLPDRGDGADDAPETTPGDPAPRRRFLGRAAGVGAAGVVAALGGQALATRKKPEAPAPLPAPATPAPPKPAGLDTTKPGISRLYTPNSDFYRVDISLSPPNLARDEWDLTINGMVDSPVTITWNELVSMPMVEHDITINCVSNEVGGRYIGNARWVGVPVADLLKKVSIKSGADMVLSRGGDGFTASTPLDVLTDNGRLAMIAVSMNGEALSVPHGYPARLITPGLYGFVGATKWVRELKVTRFDADRAYWSDRGWSERGPVKASSKIDVPSSGANLQAGEVVIGGVAWAQHTGIKHVEVRVDEGEWQQATLGPDIGTDAWRQWYLAWDAKPGQHRLTVRTTTLAGELQIEASAPVAPDGATGWHSIPVTVK